MMRIQICIFSVLISLTTYAQHTNFNTQRNWTLNKKDVFFGAGATQFNGDLGGVNKLGPEHKISDLNWPSTSWNAQAGYRFRFHPFWATTSKIHIGQLQGNDALKIDEFQNSRNLHFRSFYLELSQRIEILLLVNEKLGCLRYSLGRRPIIYYQLYAYAGLGLLFYNPQANYNGNWIDLQPHRTEGQGLAGGPKPYKRATASIPLGIGFRWGISRMWRMGLEIEYVPTLSDYLDDVGGVYYDQNQLATEIGEISSNLSNPSTQNTEWFATGQQRGNDRLDGFFSFSFLISRNITYKDYSRIRRKSEREESRESED